MARLKRTASPPGRRLLAMLEFEFRALRAAATNHPAALALGRVAALVSPPAIIVLVAGRSGDAEALLITLEKLSGRNYTVLEAQPSARRP